MAPTPCCACHSVRVASLLALSWMRCLWAQWPTSPPLLSWQPLAKMHHRVMDTAMVMDMDTVMVVGMGMGMDMVTVIVVDMVTVMARDTTTMTPSPTSTTRAMHTTTRAEQQRQVLVWPSRLAC